MKTTAKCLGLLFVLVLVSVPVMADSFTPYPTPGTQNGATYSFTAATTGNITAYFYGSDASYTSLLGLSINGAPAVYSTLNNHTSSYGDHYSWAVTAGDSLVFVLDILTNPPDGTYYSDETMNIGGEQHIYSTGFLDDGPPDGIPDGTYVAFEDRSALSGPMTDWDYNDHEFVFTNIQTIPEPGILLLLGFGMGAVSLVSFRWKK